MQALKSLSVLGITLGAKRRALARAEEAGDAPAVASLQLAVAEAEQKLETQRREVKAASAARKEEVRRRVAERVAAATARARAAAEQLHWLAAVAVDGSLAAP